MSHEITEHDGVVLTGEPAWHGLGTVVENAPTPLEALQLAGLDWTVEQWPLTATNGEGTRIALENRFANVRTDIHKELGIVSGNWKPFQNRELAEFCEALAEENDTVKVESAGSIRGGGKVWFLLRGESFSVRDRDEVMPYICVSNGFDGGTAVRASATSVRVACSNTLHMVIPEETGKTIKRYKQGEFVCAHVGDLAKRVDDAKAALRLYNRTVDETRSLMDQLAARDVTRQDVERFFFECYTRDFGGIADNPITAAEKSARTKAMDAFACVRTRFDKERDIAGTTRWNMLNAYTGWLQHDRKMRDGLKINANLFGVNADRSLASLAAALRS